MTRFGGFFISSSALSSSLPYAEAADSIRALAHHRIAVYLLVSLTSSWGD